MKIRLTTAQVSAIECRDWSEEPLVVAAWRGQWLTIPEDDAEREQLWRDINDASNAEDAVAEDPAEDPVSRRYARRAAWSLSCVARRVICQDLQKETSRIPHFSLTDSGPHAVE